MGNNDEGELGIGTLNNQTNIPVKVASKVVAVAAGAEHSLYVKNDGTLWAMGWNGYGQLGNSSDGLGYIPTPLNVAGNVVAAAAGSFHSLFLKNDGTLWATGDNESGQLGSGTLDSVYISPIDVASNVVVVAAGAWHSLFVKNDGTDWTMGDNYDGQLGNGTTIDTDLPTQVFGLSLANIISGTIALHTLAVGLPQPPQNFTASLGGAGLQLQLCGTPSYPYVLLRATNLAPPVVWQPVVTNLTDTNGNWSFTDSISSSAPARFYRAAAQ
jgi:hypothetical protein